MNSKQIKLTLLLMAVFCFSGCFSGCFECISSNHSYSANITFSPETKVLHVGDTLWLGSNFPCSNLLNTASGQTEDFCGASNLGTDVGMILMERDSLGVIMGATDRFAFINVIGEIFTAPEIQPHRIKQISFQEQNNEYSLRIGFIPLQTGKFGLFPGNAANVKQDAQSDCTDQADFTFVLTNMTRNTELYQDFLGAGGYISDYEREHGYFF